jgi:hypothetical protein
VKKGLREGDSSLSLARAKVKADELRSDHIFISPRGPEDDLHNCSGKAHGGDCIFHLQARNYGWYPIPPEHRMPCDARNKDGEVKMPRKEIS